MSMIATPKNALHVSWGGRKDYISTAVSAAQLFKASLAANGSLLVSLTMDLPDLCTRR
jgi:hypothetical protein